MWLLVSCNYSEKLICEDWNDVCDNHSTYVDPSKGNRKVLIIGIDGFRPDANQPGITPFLNEYSFLNTTYYTNHQRVEQLTFSGPNWSSILTGVHWCKHQVTTNEFTGNRLYEFPHLFKYIEQADSSYNTASIIHWTPINEHITLNFADYTLTGVADKEVYQTAQDILSECDPIDPDIMFLHFVESDVMGHAYGFSPDVPEYANILSIIDGYVRDLVSIIETKRKNGEDWMVLIVSDHGGDGKGHYDYENDNIRYTIFFANHPDLKFKYEYTSSQVDLAPTILDFMGISIEEFNCKTDGISIIN